ncbi:hypothetical protein KJ359_011297 [Pestalotiopsis sp. 9143b]|nr:hypothetical protein KJ359_011297 [Pestalotiopsis sp. 9143b]
MVKHWCIEEILIPCDIHRGYWEAAVYRAFQTLALAENTIKVVNLFIPTSTIQEALFCGKTYIHKSEKVMDKLFWDDDFKLIDLRDDKAVGAMREYFDIENDERSPARIAQFLFCNVNSTETQFHKLFNTLRAQWLHSKWHQEGRKGKLSPGSRPRARNIFSRTQVSDWNLKGAWEKQALATMPEIRPVFAIAKDESWYSRGSHRKWSTRARDYIDKIQRAGRKKP